MNIKIAVEDLPLVLSVTEMATVLRIGKNAAYTLISTNQIRCIRIGRAIRVPREELVLFLECLK